MTETTATVRSALTWFEIPVVDFDRARRFYETILDSPIPEQRFGEARIAMFAADGGGLPGCIDESSQSKPTGAGVVIYFSVDGRMDRALELAESAGGRIALAKTAIPGVGDVAHVIDSEGNRIGLHAKT